MTSLIWNSTGPPTGVFFGDWWTPAAPRASCAPISGMGALVESLRSCFKRRYGVDALMFGLIHVGRAFIFESVGRRVPMAGLVASPSLSILLVLLRFCCSSLGGMTCPACPSSTPMHADKIWGLGGARGIVHDDVRALGWTKCPSKSIAIPYWHVLEISSLTVSQRIIFQGASLSAPSLVSHSYVPDCVCS